MSMPDIRFENHGTIWLARHLTDAGQRWLLEHVAFEQHWGDAGVIEHRYVQPIVEGAHNDGLNVEVV